MIKRTLLTALAVVLISTVLPVGAGAEVKAGITLSNAGLESFYLAIGEYNRVPVKNVATVRRTVIAKRYLTDEELPVAYFIASRAKVPVEDVVKLRLAKRWTWMKIAHKYRLNPEVFYFDAGVQTTGRIYGETYKRYKKYPRNKWSRVKLSDSDIINMVNLRFVSERYGHKPADVIKMREAGSNFITINSKVRDVKVVKTKVKGKHDKKVVVKKKVINKTYKKR